MSIFKKTIALAAAAAAFATTTASAFTFPTPDWGALLAEKTAMVKTTDFELYTQGSIDSAPYYGARLEPRAGAYIGMIAETSEDFAPLGSYLTYIADMGQDDLYYPASDMIANGSSVATIGWTVNSLDTVDYNQVRSVLDTLAAYNKPMFIRFANEMNVSTLGDDPEKYVSVFQTVANMVHEYPNFAVVWSPNDLGALDRPFEYYYPGDEYVDWIGVSSYMKKYFQGSQNTAEKDTIYFMTGTYAWATNALKPIISFMEEYNINKPLMISEGGVSTNTSYGDDMTAWAAPRLRNMLYNVIMKYPQVKLINIFNTHRSGEVERYDISGYAYAEEIFKEAAASGAYIREAYGTPQFTFAKADAGETLTVDADGYVPLYTLAYRPSDADLSVNYYIDGTWQHSSATIPYTYYMNAAALADGAHTLKIQSDLGSKSYTFYKSGNAVRFGAEPDMSAVTATATTTAAAEISVTYNGAYIDFADQAPVMVNDRTLVPLRAIFETMGASVSWDDDTQTVTAVRDGVTVSLTIGNDVMTVNESGITLDVPAQMINDRTLVPTRAIAEAFGANVAWDDATQTVIITE